MASRPWTHDELAVAYNLYCRLPFGQCHYGNSQIVELASLIGRSANAVAMKLCNFASLDPIHNSRGVKGLSNTSRMDKVIWEEFHSNWENAVMVSDKLMAQMINARKNDGSEMTLPNRPTGVDGISHQRRGQSFFRQAVLSAYSCKCCITGISQPDLLVASHIMPWSTYPQERLNPKNGLCLSSLHDAAFDRGLITLDEQYRVVLSNEIRKAANNIYSIRVNFTHYEFCKISLPDKFIPDQTFLEMHRSRIFQG